MDRKTSISSYEALGSSAKKELKSARYHEWINLLVNGCRKRNLLETFGNEEEALLRFVILLDTASRAEPERERTPQELEIIDYAKQRVADFSDTPQFANVSQLGSDLVTLFYNLEAVKAPSEAAISLVDMVKHG